MYNRYIPGSNGIYQRQIVEDKNSLASEAIQKQETIHLPSAPPSADSHMQADSFGFDLGDLLLFCVIILIMLDSNQEDTLSILIAAAAFILLP